MIRIRENHRLISRIKVIALGVALVLILCLVDAVCAQTRTVWFSEQKELLKEFASVTNTTLRDIESFNDEQIQALPTINVLAKDETGVRIAAFAPCATLTTLDAASQKQGMPLTEISLKGAIIDGQAGEPALPAYPLFIAVPTNAKIELVIDKVNREVIPGEYMIATIAGQGDEGIDEGNPREVIEIVKDMQVRGKRVLQIVYHPVSFDAKESRLSAAWMAQWHLSYSYPQALPTQDTHKPWEVEFAAAIPGVINATNAPLVAERDSENEKTEYVIVAHDAFYNAIQPLVKQKEAKGLRVTTIKLSEIAGGYTGDNGFIDNYSIETANMFADRITVYLRKLYDQRQDKPLYVLLVGDAQFVPPHYRTNHVNYIDSQESVAKKRVATDLYYGVFEQDDKGNYSIYTKYVPDLFVGRLPCKTAEECSVMVEKIVCMENNHSGSFDFSRNVLLAGSIASDAVSEYLSENGFQVNTSIAMNLDPAHYTLAAQPIIDAVNQGVGLVYYRGEGTKFSWSDPYFDSATQGMSIADLRNQERYPWIIAAASLTGRFDPLYEENNQMVIGNQDSFAESWLKAQGSGAYAVIAATHEQPTCLSSSFNAMPSYLISSDNQDARHFGALLQYSKMSTLHYLPYASDRMQRTAFELYQLFGDPEAGPLVEANSMLAKSN